MEKRIDMIVILKDLQGSRGRQSSVLKSVLRCHGEQWRLQKRMAIPIWGGQDKSPQGTILELNLYRWMNWCFLGEVGPQREAWTQSLKHDSASGEHGEALFIVLQDLRERKIKTRKAGRIYTMETLEVWLRILNTIVEKRKVFEGVARWFIVIIDLHFPYITTYPTLLFFQGGNLSFSLPSP